MLNYSVAELRYIRANQGKLKCFCPVDTALCGLFSPLTAKTSYSLISTYNVTSHCCTMQSAMYHPIGL